MALMEQPAYRLLDKTQENIKIMVGMKQYLGKILLLALVVCIALPIFSSEVITTRFSNECKNQSACSEAIHGAIFTARDTDCFVCHLTETARLLNKTLKLAGFHLVFICLLALLIQIPRGYAELVSRTLSLITLKIRLNS